MSETGSRDREALAALGRYAGSATLILSSLADGEKHGYALTKDIQAFAAPLDRIAGAVNFSEVIEFLRILPDANTDFPRWRFSARQIVGLTNYQGAVTVIKANTGPLGIGGIAGHAVQNDGLHAEITIQQHFEAEADRGNRENRRPILSRLSQVRADPEGGTKK